jgi:hypothetical protein
VKLWYAEEEQCQLTEHRAVRKAQPNKPLKLTPLRVERDQGVFEIQKQLECHLDLSVRRSLAAGRWAALAPERPCC